MAAARTWFRRAKAVTESRNYDYAIECYVSGLHKWPEAVEEGHKPLRVVATARRQVGKKGLGFLDIRKHPTGGKSAVQNMLNAEFIWAHDPSQTSYTEAFVINAAKAGAGSAGAWMASICIDSLYQEKKVAPARFAAIYTALDQILQSAQQASAYCIALDAAQQMVRLTETWARQHPQAQDSQKAYADASGKLTIVKGRFDSAESFRDSMKDRQAQADLHDVQRIAQSDARMDDLVARALADWEADKQSVPKLLHYIELLARRERDQDENQAVALLVQEFQRTQNYSLKVRADDLRMKQMSRHIRRLRDQLQPDPDNAARRAELDGLCAKALGVETEIFEERTRYYPTDLRFRFGLAQRYFLAQRYDDAIPLFQQAQADRRQRSQSRLYLGRAFYAKGLMEEAAGILKEAVNDHEIPSDDVGKKLHYWLARAHEAAGQKEDAARLYGQIIQWEYNFDDARARLEQIRRERVGGGGA